MNKKIIALKLFFDIEIVSEGDDKIKALKEAKNLSRRIFSC
jgi:hypothetical protein